MRPIKMKNKNKRVSTPASAPSICSLTSSIEDVASFIDKVLFFGKKIHFCLVSFPSRDHIGSIDDSLLLSSKNKPVH